MGFRQLPELTLHLAESLKVAEYWSFFADKIRLILCFCILSQTFEVHQYHLTENKFLEMNQRGSDFRKRRTELDLLLEILRALWTYWQVDRGYNRGVLEMVLWALGHQIIILAIISNEEINDIIEKGPIFADSYKFIQ